MSLRQFSFGALLLCAADLICHTAAAQTFVTFDVPEAGLGFAEGTLGLSINASGDVAGFYLLADTRGHGFVRSSSGVITTFDVPGAGTGKTQGTYPVSINAIGTIAGTYFDAKNRYHGFVRSPDGTIATFDVPGAGTAGHRGTMPLSINATGDITGLYNTNGSIRHGFIRSASGAITTFDIPGAGASYRQGTVPVSINAGGVITGFYRDSNGVNHVFVRSPTGSITAPIDPPGVGTIGVEEDFEYPFATSINSRDDITGSSIDSGRVTHGFVRTVNGTITTFEAPGAATVAPPIPPVKMKGIKAVAGTLGVSMNDSGEITGFYSDKDYLYHAFIRAADGAITAPLDAPGAATSSMNLLAGTYAFGINAAGAITGTYADSAGILHGFIRTAGPSTCASNVSGQTTVTRGGFRFDHSRNVFVQTVTVRNNGPALSSISLVLDDLSSDAKLTDSGGATQCAAPLASPWIAIPETLATGESSSVILTFSDTSMGAIRYTTRVLAGKGVQ